MRLTLLLAAFVLGLAALAFADEGDVTVDDLVTLIELEIDDAEIVARIRAAKGLNLSRGDIQRLERAGASGRVLAAARTRMGAKGQSVVQRTLTLLQKKAGERAILDYLLSVKKLPKITTDDILRLRRAGATKNVLRALQGRYMPEGHALYRHPLSFYTLLHPTEFKPIDFRDEGEHTVAFTPERMSGYVTDAETLTEALYIRLSPMDAYSRWVDAVPVEELIQRMGKQRAAELRDQNCACGSGTGFRGVSSTLAGVPGAHVFNERTVDGKRLRERLWIGFTKRFYVRVHVVAPKASFEATSRKLETALRTLRLDPNRPRTGRLDEPVDRRTFLEQYRESVVMIRAHFEGGGLGYGTGFFVREDGYLLTNHHVVHNQGRAATKIEVVWDADVSKDAGDTNRVVPARLIDAVIGDGPLVDLALLRVPRTKWRYKPLPLSPVAHGHVEAEDEVIALGFPVPTSFKRVGRLITTNGHLSRINRLADIGASKELLDDAVLDITINKGNSGGPCVDLRTGGVIGLNTQIVLAPSSGGSFNKLEYGRVCLIDHALRRFPQLRWHPVGEDPRADLRVDLINALMAWGDYDAAGIQLLHADRIYRSLAPADQARLLMADAMHHSHVGKYDGYERQVKKALEVDPKSPEALLQLAYDTQDKDRVEEALGYVARLERLQPTAWRVAQARAVVLQRVGRYEEARAAVERAFELGGEYHPEAHEVRSTVLAGLGRLDEAERALQKGLDEAPHADTHIALARFLEEKRGDASRARRAYEDAILRYPKEPGLHEAFAVHLRKHGLTDRAHGHLVQAAELTRLRNAKLTFGTLDNLFHLGKAKGSRYSQDALLAAIMLAERWEDYGSKRLAEFWSLRSRDNLASAHRGEMVALDKDDLQAMVSARYPSPVAKQVLAKSSIDVRIGTTLDLAKQRRWPPWFTNLVLERFESDWFNRTSALGSKVKFDLEGGFRIGDSPWAIVKLTNTSNVPLTSLTLFLTYKQGDKNLWSGSVWVPAWYLPLQPGESIRSKFFLHTKKKLTENGVDLGKVSTVVWNTDKALNAEFLQALKPKIRSTRGRYELEVENVGTLDQHSLLIREEFFHPNDKPILGSNDIPIGHSYLLRESDLVKGKSKRTFTIPKWGDESYLRSLGLRGEFVRRVQIAEAVVVRPGK